MIAELIALFAVALVSVACHIYYRDHIADLQKDWERDVRLDDMESRLNELESNRED